MIVGKAWYLLHSLWTGLVATAYVIVHNIRSQVPTEKGPRHRPFSFREYTVIHAAFVSSSAFPSQFLPHLSGER